MCGPDLYIYHAEDSTPDVTKIVETIPLNNYKTDEIHSLLLEKGITKPQAAVPPSPAPPPPAIPANSPSKLPKAPPPMTKLPTIPAPVIAPAAAVPVVYSKPTHSDTQSTVTSRSVNPIQILVIFAAVAIIAGVIKSRSKADAPLKFYRSTDDDDASSNASSRGRKRIEV